MADLPRIFAEPNLPFSELPRAQPTGTFQHLARVTAGLAGQFQQIEDASVEAESRRVIADTQAKIQDAIKQGDANEVNPEAFHKNTTEQVGGIYSETLKGIKNERVKAKFEDHLSPFLIKSQTDIDLGKRQKEVLQAQANSVMFLDGAARRMGQLDNPVEIAKEEANVVDHIDSMIRTGSMKPEEGVKAVIKVRDDTAKEKIAWLTLTNPEKLLLAIKDPLQFPTLKGTERVAAEQHALEAMRERRVADERAAQARIDAQKDNYFKRAEAPGANLSSIRQEVLNDPTLDVKTRISLVDRFNHSINAIGKGELDPFTHTDGNVYKSVLQGIYSDPSKWSNSKINEFVGRGLSISHADQLRGELKQAQAGAGNTDIKKQILEQVDRYRHNQMFLPADKRLGKNTPTEDILTNDRISQQILDQVWQRANNPQKPEDPRAVLQELMVPHYEAQTKSWFDTIRTWGANIGALPEAARPALSNTSDKEIEAARKILVRNGITPTPEGLDKVIQNARNLKAAGASQLPVVPGAPAVPAPGTTGAAVGAKIGGTAGPAQFEGRPIVQNPDGSWSHERAITIEAGGVHMNIPTMFGGKQFTPDQAVEIMRKNNWVDPDTGKKVQTYKTQSEALKAAQSKEASQQSAIPYLSEVSLFFKQRFNRTLPISAEGQSATHDKMGYQHAQAFDVALSPQSHEGMALMEYLDSRKIPFIGFTAAVPGVATGPHIHVGKPSARMMPVQDKPVY